MCGSSMFASRAVVVSAAETTLPLGHRSPHARSARIAAVAVLLCAIVATSPVAALGPAAASGGHLGPSSPGGSHAAVPAATPSAALPSAGAPGPAGPGANTVLATLNLANHTAVAGASRATNNLPAPDMAAYDSGNHLAYVLNPHRVLVVNETSHAVVGVLSVGSTPDWVLYGPGTGEVFVASGVNSSVTIINDTTNTVVATLLIPTNVSGLNSTPDLLVYDSVDRTVLVAEGDEGLCCTTSLAVIDPSVNEVTRLIPNVTSPIALSFNAQDNLLYDLGGYFSAPSVYVYNLTSMVLQSTWSLPSPLSTQAYWTGITVDPLSGVVYVASTTFGRWANLTVFNAASGTSVTSVTVFSGASTFGGSTPVYAPATGNVYVTMQGGLLYSIKAATAVLSPGVLVGECLGPMVLSGVGAPLLLTDGCSDALYWLDGTTAVVLATTPIGASPVDIAQVPGSGYLAVVENHESRIDFINGTTLQYGNQAYFPGWNPVLITADPATRWAYGVEVSSASEKVSALDPASAAVMWAWTAGSTATVEGIGDANGTVWVAELVRGVCGLCTYNQELVALNATTGAVVTNWTIGSSFPLSATAFATGIPVLAVPGSAELVTSVPALNETVGFDTVTGVTDWARPTGTNATGAFLLPGNETLVLGTGNGTGLIEFLNVTTGAYLRGLPTVAPLTALASDPSGQGLFAIESGNVIQVNATTGASSSVGYPTGDTPQTLRSLAPSGGIAVVSPNLGAVYWVGAPVSVASFGASGTPEQGKPLTLVTNATGGFGTYHYVYSLLPEGCASSDSRSLTCTPLDAGGYDVAVSVTDATPSGEANATASLTLAPYPLSATILVTNGSAERGLTMALAAQLTTNESGFASAVNYSWSLAPSSAGTFNRTNASATTITFSGSGAVSVALTLHLRSTSAVEYYNFTVATGSSASSSLLSGTTLWIVLGVVAAAIVVIAAVVLMRRRPASPAPEAEAPPPPAEAPVEEAAPPASE